jgi:hypothetical protein
MKTVLLTLAVPLLMVLTLPLRAEDRPSPEASLFMRQKLQASQAVLAGLASGDYEAIGRNAQAMNVVEQLEKWLRANTPGYRTQLRLFEFADRELIRAAREKNIDAATLAYNQLTISCVNCHKIIRDTAR